MHTHPIARLTPLGRNRLLGRNIHWHQNLAVLAAQAVQRPWWMGEPSDMIHVGTKQVARLESVGHRLTGDRGLGSSLGAGYEKHTPPSTMQPASPTSRC
jgi:hypothetical protein